MESVDLSSALQALYSAEVDVSIISQWDAGWLVKVSTAFGLRLTQRFDDGAGAQMAAWVLDRADDLAPGWRVRG